MSYANQIIGDTGLKDTAKTTRMTDLYHARCGGESVKNLFSLSGFQLPIGTSDLKRPEVCNSG
jgi:hypothetical protein